MENVKVTLIKSRICAKPNQKKTADSLGLHKIGDSVIHANDKVLEGKLKIIGHLVTVENA